MLSLKPVAALFATLLASSAVARHHDAGLIRRAPVFPSQVNITTVNGAVRRRDLPPVSYGFSLIGCVDEINNGPIRVLNHQVPWDMTSVYTCVVACFNAGTLTGPVPNTGPFGHYLFAGVVNGDKCFCGNTINAQAHTVDLESRCNHLCANGPDEYCGGSREYQMYFLQQTGLEPFSVIPKPPASTGLGTGLYNYLGCYADSPSNGRVLRGLSYSGPEVTPGYCSAFCWAYGYTYSGVEYGHECYCDNTLAHAGPVVDNINCNQICDSDELVTCGAPGYINVYHTDSPSRLTL